MNKLLVILFSLYLSAFSQDSIPFWEKHFEANGYLKFMQTFNGDFEGNIYDQSLWHNRINTKYFNYNKEGGTEFYFELRNRIFYGEGIRINPDIIDALDIDGGVFDLSFVAEAQTSLDVKCDKF